MLQRSPLTVGVFAYSKRDDYILSIYYFSELITNPNKENNNGYYN